MAKKTSRTVSPEKVAEQAKKNWKIVVTMPSDMSPGDKADAVSAELDALKKRYKMSTGGALKARLANDTKEVEKVSMVTMEPRQATTENRVSRKTVLIKGKKIIGEQG